MNKRKIINIVIIVIVIAIFALAIAYLLPIMKDISTKEGQIEFKEKIDNLGILGMLILAGMCYGSIGGTIFITLSVFITTAILYFLVRKYGRKFVYESFKKEKIDKIENSKILKNPKKVEVIMIILFLIPGTPKDLLVYIGGLLPIKPLRFILISTFARFPSVISSTIVGSKLAQGDIKTSALVYGVTFLITAIILAIINLFDKEKETKQALEALK